MGWLLALDGATEQLALALVREDGEGIARDLPGGAQASGRLIPAIKELLAEAGVQGRELDALAFGQGPGAFTGLRAVCAVTQGLAMGWALPVLAIDSLLIPVEAVWARGKPRHWGCVMDARMGEVYAARYERRDDVWLCLESPGLWQADALMPHWASIGEPEALAGNGLGLVGHTVQEPGSRAAALGRLAALAVSGRQEQLDASLALPRYVRDKVALTTAERAALAARAS
ncbi:MAG: tRNA (adenosine(37)-N6)-threonylcarbamoyltransferase complex dimerization subunit type 1 TsaB [Inhella sp.]